MQKKTTMLATMSSLAGQKCVLINKSKKCAERIALKSTTFQYKVILKVKKLPSGIFSSILFTSRNINKVNQCNKILNVATLKFK